MSTDEDKYESAMDFIAEVCEAPMTAFSKIIAISTVLNGLNPMSEEDFRRGMEVAGYLERGETPPPVR